jgi:hypothetical protein
MTAEILLMVSLAALAAFILWESWQRSKPADPRLTQAMGKRGFTPGATGPETVLFWAATLAAVVAVHLFVEPAMPPFTGRGSLVMAFLHHVFGPYGPAAAAALTAAATLSAAVWARRRRRSMQARRTPG